MYVLAALALACAIGYIGFRYYRSRNSDGLVRDLNGVVLPGPGTVHFQPFLGHALYVATARMNHCASLVVKQMVDEFGKGDLIGMKMVSTDVMVLAHPELIRSVLSGHHTKFPKHKKYDRMKDILGDGLITSSGETWRTQRHIINPAFHAGSLHHMIATFNKHTQILVDKWLEDVQGQAMLSIDPNEGFTSLTFDIMCDAGFGFESHTKLSRDGSMRDAFRTILEESSARVGDVFAWLKYVPWRYFAVKQQTKLVVDLLNGIIGQRVAEKNTQQSPPTDVVNHGSARDLLDVVIDAFWQDPKLKNNVAQIRDHAITFLAAGHETTAGQMQWVMYELSQNPDIQQKCREEVEAVLGDSSVVLHEHMSELKYLQQVLKESLRLHPSAPTITRQPSETVQIGSYLIPAGTVIAIGIYAVHRHKDFWEEPERFDPDRWSPTRMPSTMKHSFQYIPFSAGPRNCIGQRFAHFESLVILCHVLKNFEIQMNPACEGKINYYETITTRPDGLLVNLIPL